MFLFCVKPEPEHTQKKPAFRYVEGMREEEGDNTGKSRMCEAKVMGAGMMG